MKKNIFSAVFLDAVQAFDKVWYYGIKYKLYKDLSVLNSISYLGCTLYTYIFTFSVRMNTQFEENCRMLTNQCAGTQFVFIVYKGFI